jgi:hypothetical protein
MALKLVQFRNMTMRAGYSKVRWSFEDYVWFDHVSFNNPATDPPFEAVRLGYSLGTHAQVVGAFITDVYMDNMGDGPRDTILARNVFADHTGGGHSSGSQTVVNYTVNVIFGSGYPFEGGKGPDYHGDLYQFYGRTSDVILYGIRTTPGAWTSTRGFAGDTSDVAIIKSDITVSGYAFSACSANHLVIQQTQINGATDWCSESGMAVNPENIKNALMDRSLFGGTGGLKNQPHPAGLPGVKVLN